MSRRALSVFVVAVLEPVPAVIVVIRVVNQRVRPHRGENVDLLAVIKTVVVGVFVHVVGSVDVVLVPVHKAVIVPVGEVVTLVDIVVAVVVDPVQQFGFARVDVGISVVAVVEVVEQVRVRVRVVDQRVAQPVVHLGTVAETVVVGVRIERVRAGAEHLGCVGKPVEVSVGEQRVGSVDHDLVVVVQTVTVGVWVVGIGSVDQRLVLVGQPVVIVVVVHVDTVQDELPRVQGAVSARIGVPDLQRPGPER